MNLGFKASPTGQQFLASDKFVKIICGPVGGGKSTIALFELLTRSVRQQAWHGERRTRHIILRNTMAQLKSTVKPLIDEWFVRRTNNRMGRWRLTDHTFEARFLLPDKTLVHSEFLMIAADTPEDIRRLLSLEGSDAWIEECREVDPEIAQGLQGRVARYPNRASGGVTYPGIIGSTNPPPMGTWWQQQMSNPPENWGVFMQPAALLEDGSINPEAENLDNLDPDYYDNLITGKTDDWINVYLRNQFGAGDLGQPVFRASFKRSFHVASSELKAVFQSINPLIVGMDNGLQAAAVVGQQDARGRINVLDECFVPEDTTMGVESFLDRLLVPKLRATYAQFRNENIVFVLDPACFQRSQVDEKTIAQAVMQRGYKVLRASTNDPERRVAAVEELFGRQVDGKAGMLIDPRCTHLINALEWGYRYKKTASGQMSPSVEKNHYSHIGESLQYFALHYNVQAERGTHFGRQPARKVSRANYVYA